MLVVIPQAVLRRTTPHWPESRPDLTWLDPTGPYRPEDGQSSPKQQVAGSSPARGTRNRRSDAMLSLHWPCFDVRGHSSVLCGSGRIALLGTNFGSSVERTAKVHPLWQTGTKQPVGCSMSACLGRKTGCAGQVRVSVTRTCDLLRGRPKGVAYQAPELHERKIGITPFDCPCDTRSRGRDADGGYTVMTARGWSSWRQRAWAAL
jgi:hypothetical protein